MRLYRALGQRYRITTLASKDPLYAEFCYSINNNSLTISCCNSAMASEIGSITLNKQTWDTVNIDIPNWERKYGLAMEMGKVVQKVKNGEFPECLTIDFS